MMSSDIPMQTADTRSFAMIRTLGAIAAISGLLVVMVFELTKPAIEANKQALIERAVFQVIPGATQRRDFVISKNGIAPASEITKNGITVYAGYSDDGGLQGIAAEAAAQGYQDVIRLLYGYSPDCECITGIRVLKLSETPGLGDKIITDKEFVANFKALEARLNTEMSALANAIVTVKHGTKTHPWEIDAISGATISSTAVGKALNDSTQIVLPLLVPNIEKLKGDKSQREAQEKQEGAATDKSITGEAPNARIESGISTSPTFVSKADNTLNGGLL